MILETVRNYFTERQMIFGTVQNDAKEVKNDFRDDTESSQGGGYPPKGMILLAMQNDPKEREQNYPGEESPMGRCKLRHVPRTVENYFSCKYRMTR